MFGFQIGWMVYKWFAFVRPWLQFTIAYRCSWISAKNVLPNSKRKSSTHVMFWTLSWKCSIRLTYKYEITLSFGKMNVTVLHIANVSSSLQTNNIRVRQLQICSLTGALAVPGFEHRKAGTCCTISLFVLFLCPTKLRWRTMASNGTAHETGQIWSGAGKTQDFGHLGTIFKLFIWPMLSSGRTHAQRWMHPCELHGWGTGTIQLSKYWETRTVFSWVQVIGHNNKYNCHKFVPGQPRGLLPWPQQNDMKSGKSDSLWI